MKAIILKLLPFLDVLMAPFVWPVAIFMKAIRKAGVQRLPICKSILLKVGVFPIRNHYYEPLFDGSSLSKPLNKKRDLPGIDWNSVGQLDLLNSFQTPTELKGPFENDFFGNGDSEYFYNMIRHKKSKRIFEIGSGHSTLIARSAIEMNHEENPDYSCLHICIEPYEMPWLEQTGAKIIRKKVEEIELSFFEQLEESDILFIDSSHMIRPQGDVLYEYQNIIPLLKKGVIVHIHDIFSPRDYPKRWVVDEVKFWNEQYLLEAFLTFNKEWRIIGALNYLHHNHFKLLKEKCPYLTPDQEPGSFYIQRV